MFGDLGARSGLSRRELIAAGAWLALPGGAAATAEAARVRPTPRRRVDVVVVGAALAGLTAARDLVARGRSVVVLEARDRGGASERSVVTAGGGP